MRKENKEQPFNPNVTVERLTVDHEWTGDVIAGFPDCNDVLVCHDLSKEHCQRCSEQYSYCNSNPHYIFGL